MYVIASLTSSFGEIKVATHIYGQLQLTQNLCGMDIELQLARMLKHTERERYN